MATKKPRTPTEEADQYPRYMDPTLASMSARERIEQSAKLLGELQSDFKAGLRGPAAPPEVAPKKVKAVPVVSEGARFLTPTQSSKKLLGPASPSAKAAALRPSNPLDIEKKWNPASKAAVIPDDSSVSKVPATSAYKNVQPRYMNKPQPPPARAPRADVSPTTTPSTGKVRKRVGASSTALSKSVDLGDIKPKTPSPRSMGRSLDLGDFKPNTQSPRSLGKSLDLGDAKSKMTSPRSTRQSLDLGDVKLKAKAAKTLENREPWNPPKAWEKPAVFSDKRAKEVQSLSPRVLEQGTHGEEDDGSDVGTSSNLFSEGVVLMDNEVSLMDNIAVTPTAAATGSTAFTLSASPVRMRTLPLKPTPVGSSITQEGTFSGEPVVAEWSSVTPTASTTARAAATPLEDRPAWHAPTEQDKSEVEEAARRTRERMQRYAEEHGFVKPKSNRTSASSGTSVASASVASASANAALETVPSSAETQEVMGGSSIQEEGGEAEVTSKLTEGALDATFKVKALPEDGAAAATGQADDIDIVAAAQRAMDAARETEGLSLDGDVAEGTALSRDFSFGLNVKTKEAPSTASEGTEGKDHAKDGTSISGANGTSESVFTPRSVASLKSKKPRTGPLVNVDQIVLQLVPALSKAAEKGADVRDAINYHWAAFLLSMFCLLSSILVGALGIIVMSRALGVAALLATALASGRAALLAAGTQLQAKVAPTLATVKGKLGGLHAATAASLATFLAQLSSSYNGAASALTAKAGSVYSGTVSALSSAGGSISAGTGGAFAAASNATSSAFASLSNAASAGLASGKDLLARVRTGPDGKSSLKLFELLASAKGKAQSAYKSAYKAGYKHYRRWLKVARKAWRARMKQYQVTPQQERLLFWGLVSLAALLVVGLVAIIVSLRRRAKNRRRKAAEAKAAAEEAKKAEAARAAAIEAAQAKAAAAAAAAPRGGQGLTAALRQDSDTSDSDFAPDEAVDVMPVPMPSVIKVDARGPLGTGMVSPVSGTAGVALSEAARPTSTYVDSSDELQSDSDEEDTEDNQEEEDTLPAESESASVVTKDDAPEGQFAPIEPAVEEDVPSSDEDADEPPQEVEQDQPAAVKEAAVAPESSSGAAKPTLQGARHHGGSSGDSFDPFNSGSGGPWALSPFAETAAQMRAEVDREYQATGLGKETVQENAATVVAAATAAATMAAKDAATPIVKNLGSELAAVEGTDAVELGKSAHAGSAAASAMSADAQERARALKAELAELGGAKKPAPAVDADAVNGGAAAATKAAPPVEPEVATAAAAGAVAEKDAVAKDATRDVKAVPTATEKAPEKKPLPGKADPKAAKKKKQRGGFLVKMFGCYGGGPQANMN